MKDSVLDVAKIRRLIVQEKYEFSKHAEREREIDMIYLWELEDALRDCESLGDGHKYINKMMS